MIKRKEKKKSFCPEIESSCRLKLKWRENNCIAFPAHAFYGLLHCYGVRVLKTTKMTKCEDASRMPITDDKLQNFSLNIQFMPTRGLIAIVNLTRTNILLVHQAGIKGYQYFYHHHYCSYYYYYYYYYLCT